jgi:hypothetical protein
MLLDNRQVVLDLESSGIDAGIVQEIENGDAVEVRDADGAAETDIDETFHCGPGLLNGGVGLNGVRSFNAGVEPARWVAHWWIDVLQGNCCYKLSFRALNFKRGTRVTYGNA